MNLNFLICGFFCLKFKFQEENIWRPAHPWPGVEGALIYFPTKFIFKEKSGSCDKNKQTRNWCWYSSKLQTKQNKWWKHIATALIVGIHCLAELFCFSPTFKMTYIISVDNPFTILKMGDVSNFPTKIGCKGGKSRRIMISLESISEYSNLD